MLSGSAADYGVRVRHLDLRSCWMDRPGNIAARNVAARVWQLCRSAIRSIRRCIPEPTLTTIVTHSAVRFSGDLDPITGMTSYRERQYRSVIGAHPLFDGGIVNAAHNHLTHHFKRLPLTLSLELDYVVSSDRNDSSCWGPRSRLLASRCSMPAILVTSSVTPGDHVHAGR